MSDDPTGDTYGWVIEDDGEGSRNVRDDSGTLVMWVRWPPDAEHIVNALNDRLKLQAEIERLRTLIRVGDAAVGAGEGIGVSRYLELDGRTDFARAWDALVQE